MDHQDHGEGADDNEGGHQNRDAQQVAEPGATVDRQEVGRASPALRQVEGADADDDDDVGADNDEAFEPTGQAPARKGHGQVGQKGDRQHDEDQPCGEHDGVLACSHQHPGRQPGQAGHCEQPSDGAVGASGPPQKAGNHEQHAHPKLVGDLRDAEMVTAELRWKESGDEAAHHEGQHAGLAPRRHQAAPSKQASAGPDSSAFGMNPLAELCANRKP